MGSFVGGIAMVALLALRPLRSAMAVTQGFEGDLPPSHKDVELSEGLPVESKFHFVDEPACIGCTWCADVARNTFYMEAEKGMGRVYRQHGDSVDIIKEAIACCPVNAIHSLTWEQLVASETKREEQKRLASGNPGHLYVMPGQGVVRSRSYVESRGHVIVGSAITDEEQREREERTTKIHEEKRRALAEKQGFADVPNLDSLLDTIMVDPCDHPNSSECMLASDPCAASAEADECNMLLAPTAEINPAFFETYSVQDPCEADPSGEGCQVFTSHLGRDQELARMENYSVDDLDSDDFDPCAVADAPFVCEHESEVEKRLSHIFSNAEPSAV
jgi:ferredoxin